MKTVKLTPNMLKRMIKQEAKKFGPERDIETAPKDTIEMDADEYGTDKALEKHIDYMKALKVEEARLLRRLRVIREQKARIVQKLLK